MYTELLIGCGSRREKLIFLDDTPKRWYNLTTLDIEDVHNPTIVWDLNIKPWPLEDNSFDEVHAYEVLEHLGRSQGDYQSFFSDFYEIWRVLKPNGRLYASCPGRGQAWTWSDPGHTREISKESLTFLSQEEYRKQIGVTSMTDYRKWWKGDFITIAANQVGESAFFFVLEAKKG